DRCWISAWDSLQENSFDGGGCPTGRTSAIEGKCDEVGKARISSRWDINRAKCVRTENLSSPMGAQVSGKYLRTHEIYFFVPCLICPIEVGILNIGSIQPSVARKTL